jgi:hypothetical protein
MVHDSELGHGDGQVLQLPQNAKFESASYDMPIPYPTPPPATGQRSGVRVTPPPEWEGITTVMMRNLPNKYSQQMLLQEINEAGFQATFDFMYLPIDPDTKANRGYAFFNFIDPSFSWMFKMYFEGRKIGCFNSSKVVSVSAATLQGFAANYAHYSTARVNRGDPAARPLFLREPTQKVKSDVDSMNKRGRRRKPDAIGNSGGFTGMQRAQPPQGCQMFMGFGPKPVIAEEKPKPAQAPVAKFCPQCGGSILPRFQFCPHCGASVDFS